MAEKVNFLKKYPLIPSVFFILFAWFCLYWITAVKGKQTNKEEPLIVNELEAKDEKGTWQLSINKKGVFMQAYKMGKAEFPYPQQIILKNNAEGSVRIYTSKYLKNFIEVTVIRTLNSKTQQIIVNWNGKYFFKEQRTMDNEQ